MVRQRIQVVGARVLVLGLAFKENCPDLRNTRIVDFVRELKDFGVNVDVCDPWVAPEDARREYDIDLVAVAGSNRPTTRLSWRSRTTSTETRVSRLHALGRRSARTLRT